MATMRSQVSEVTSIAGEHLRAISAAEIVERELE